MLGGVALLPRLAGAYGPVGGGGGPPRHMQVIDALPLNASGKVLKYELRERATAAITP